MAHGRQDFVLVGYSEDLERRPLKFVDAIPLARVCSACRNVPRMTHILPCGHNLCEPCYKFCATPSECLCPLDVVVFGAAHVSCKEHPAEILLRRKVHCWNEANGCGVVLPASQITQHVRNDCQYHVTHCSKCFAVVLCRDACEHLLSRCAALVLQPAPEAKRDVGGKKTHVAEFGKKF